MTAGIVRLHGVGVIDGIQDLDDGIPAVGNFFGNFYFAVCLIGIIFIRQNTALNISVRNQILENRLRHVGVNDLLVAFAIRDDLSFEEVCRNGYSALQRRLPIPPASLLQNFRNFHWR